MKRKLSKYEKVLIAILAIAIVAVISSRQRIGTKLGKVWDMYSGKTIGSETNDTINK